MRVLILDGSSRAALAATRSLGAAGHDVFVGSDTWPCLAGSSRFCRKTIQYPNPARAVTEFAQSILENVRRHEIDFLLPISDISSLTIAEHQPEFEKECALPFRDGHVLQQAADKAYVVALSESLGVPVPRTSVIQSRDDIDSLELEFPVVIKPARSRVRHANTWLSTTVSYAEDIDDLRRQMAALSSDVFPILLQNKIAGRGLGVFACVDSGRIVAYSSHVRVREKPPSGGISVVSRSTTAPPEAFDAAKRLLQSLNWHGIAMVEFKWDERDQIPYVMEINGRFWGSLQLAITSGVDYPTLLATMCTQGTTPERPPASRAGMHNRWLWGDIDALLLSLFNSRERALLKAEGIGRLQSIRDFFRIRPSQSLEVFRASDIRPWLLETRKWFTGQ